MKSGYYVSIMKVIFYKRERSALYICEKQWEAKNKANP